MQIYKVNKNLSRHTCVKPVTQIQSKRRESFPYLFKDRVLNEVPVTMEKIYLCPTTKNETCSNLIQQQHASMPSNMPCYSVSFQKQG